MVELLRGPTLGLTGNMRSVYQSLDKKMFIPPVPILAKCSARRRILYRILSVNWPPSSRSMKTSPPNTLRLLAFCAVMKLTRSSSEPKPRPVKRKFYITVCYNVNNCTCFCRKHVHLTFHCSRIRYYSCYYLINMLF